MIIDVIIQKSSFLLLNFWPLPFPSTPLIPMILHHVMFLCQFLSWAKSFVRKFIYLFIYSCSLVCNAAEGQISKRKGNSWLIVHSIQIAFLSFINLQENVLMLPGEINTGRAVQGRTVNEKFIMRIEHRIHGTVPIFLRIWGLVSLWGFWLQVYCV